MKVIKYLLFFVVLLLTPVIVILGILFLLIEILLGWAVKGRLEEDNYV
jgi:hypothetical protein